MMTSTAVASVPVPGVRRLKYQDITRKKMRKYENYAMLLSELEPTNLLPVLYATEVITKEEMVYINNNESRRSVVVALLKILFDRENDRWIEKFFLAIEQCQQKYIIKRLRNPTQNPDFHSIATLGHTQRVSFRIKSDNREIEENIQNLSGAEILEVVQQTMDSDVLTLYDGSVVIVMRPNSLNTMKKMFNEKEVKPMLKTFLHNILLKYSLKNLHTFEKVYVEVQELPEGFIFRTAVKGDTCSDCYRKTAMTYYENIIDEIETMMMEQTFRGHEQRVPRCIKMACIEQRAERSRRERADIFFRFVLGDEALLLQFKEVFEKFSKFRTEHIPCRVHSVGRISRQSLETPIEIEFEVKASGRGITAKPLDQHYWTYANMLKRGLETQNKVDVQRRSSYADKAKTLTRFQEERYRPMSSSSVMSNFPRKAKGYSAISFNHEIHWKIYDVKPAKVAVPDKTIRILVLGSKDETCMIPRKLINNEKLLHHEFKGLHVIHTDECFDNYLGKTLQVSSCAITYHMDERDTDRYVKDLVTRCVAATAPGPHVILLPVRLPLGNKELAELETIVSIIKSQFGTNVNYYITLAIVGDSAHDIEGITMKSYPNIHGLKERKIYLRDSRDKILDQLLEMILNASVFAGSTFYTNAMFRKTEEVITSEITKIGAKLYDAYKENESAIASLKSALARLQICQQLIRETSSKSRDLARVDLLENGWVHLRSSFYQE